VVSERDHVGAGGEDLLRDLRSDAEAVGSVLAVDGAEVDAELLAEVRQQSFDRAGARCSVDVGDEEELYGIASVAAG
jgi:hypothetical protein